MDCCDRIWRAFERQRRSIPKPGVVSAASAPRVSVGPCMNAEGVLSTLFTRLMERLRRTHARTNGLSPGCARCALRSRPQALGWNAVGVQEISFLVRAG